MSRRHVVVGLIVSMLAVFVAGGTTIVAASPHAVAVRKHKATNCGGSAGLSGSGIHYFDAEFHCNGTFSRFTITTNKPIEPGTAKGHAERPGPQKALSCQAATDTITCTGVPAKDRIASVVYQSLEPCAPPMVTTSVTVNGKTRSLNASCQSSF